MNKEKIKKFIKKALLFLTNPKLLLCLAIAWMITNGWSYVVFVIGTALGIKWMIAVGGAYLAFLWLPISPEKIATVAIAIFLLKWLFPDDQKTLAVLVNTHRRVKAALHSKKEAHRKKRLERQQKKRDV
jgi:hypothetical protein